MRLAKRLAAAEPLGLGCVFLEPGAGGGDDQLTAGREKPGQLLEALGRAGEAIDEIGHQHDVELAKAIPQKRGVALLEPDAGAIHLGRHLSDGRLAKLALDGE